MHGDGRRDAIPADFRYPPSRPFGTHIPRGDGRKGRAIFNEVFGPALDQSVTAAKLNPTSSHRHGLRCRKCRPGKRAKSASKETSRLPLVIAKAAR